MLWTGLQTGAALSVRADGDDWPEPVYFPQRSDAPVAAPADRKPDEKASKDEKAAKKDAKKEKHTADGEKKHGIWPFRRAAKTPASPYPPKVTKEVLKQDPPSSPYPLLRLSLPLLAEDNRVIPTGIYLLKPEPGAGGLSTGERTIVLTRENKVMLRLAVHPSGKPDPNLAVTGTPSPITPTDPQTAAKTLKAGMQVAPDFKSVTITVQEGDQRFESNPIPTATERRPVIRF